MYILLTLIPTQNQEELMTPQTIKATGGGHCLGQTVLLTIHVVLACPGPKSVTYTIIGQTE